MIITRFILETVTPLHCGGGEDAILDQLVTRDAFGFWRIPGSSIAGILRNYLSKTSPDLEKILFGYASTSSNDSSENQASLIWCMDAYQLDFDMQPAFCKQLKGQSVKALGPFVRDHVNIDLELSTASEGGKYDEEIIPPGTRFFMELRLDGWDRDELKTEEKESFLKLCAAIANGDVTIGGKKVSGYGRLRCLSIDGKPSYSCVEYQLTDIKDLEDYLNIPAMPSLELPGRNRFSLENAQASYSAEGISFDLFLPLETDGPVMVGGPNLKEQDQDVDMICLTTPYLDYEAKEKIIYSYTLPGSSFRGVLRHGVYKVAKALKLEPEKAVESIFGYINNKEENKKASCGKVQIEDVYLQNAESVRLQHVAIDRFTGGALDSALFDEKPLFSSGLKIPLKIKATGLTSDQAKLLCHAILDLCTGMLQVGNGTNRGNGRLKLERLSCGLEQALSASGLKFTGKWNQKDLAEEGFVNFLKLLDRGEAN